MQCAVNLMVKATELSPNNSAYVTELAYCRMLAGNLKEVGAP